MLWLSVRLLHRTHSLWFSTSNCCGGFWYWHCKTELSSMWRLVAKNCNHFNHINNRNPIFFLREHLPTSLTLVSYGNRRCFVLRSTASHRIFHCICEFSKLFWFAETTVLGIIAFWNILALFYTVTNWFRLFVVVNCRIFCPRKSKVCFVYYKAMI